MVNDEGDVNFDNKVNELDAKMIEAYAAGTGKLIGINYWSCEHTVQERKDWLYKLYNNVLIPSHDSHIRPDGRRILTR